MKIQCNYCKAMFDDTNAACPYCGANNPGVVRTAADQPVTIAQLQQWYKDRGLPPYETTRFFIGVDYRQPRAFGIYQDPQTGNFVVYKNKDSGARAVRYQGTDEAYAVNELFQRLKEEILQQKSRNLQKGRPLNGALPDLPPNGAKKKTGCGMGCLIALAIFVLMALGGFLLNWIEDEPQTGYYSYNGGRDYYLSEVDAPGYYGWFYYDKGDADWTGPLALYEVKEELQKGKTADACYLQKDWDESLGVPDVKESLAYQDAASTYRVENGYYNYDGTDYYHLGSDETTGWYAYDPDLSYWYETSDYNVPEDLKHDSLAEDFYYTPTWDSDTQITDFADTDYYTDYYSSYNSGSSDWSSDWSSSSSDYSWDSGSSWDSGGSDWSSDW